MYADQTTFRKLFNGERQFVVPLYQRPYSWAKRHRQVLLNDIDEVWEHVDSAENHFLGSLVLAPPVEVAQTGMQRSLVVDGQQRLTSLYILVIAIRDKFEQLGSDRRARQITNQQLINEYETGDLVYKLLPTQADRSAIKNLIFKSEPAPAGSEITAAYTQFAGAISGYSESELDQLLTVVNTRLEFIAISLQHDDNAYRIFESLNDKGMSLTQGDLLRNHIFMLLPTRAEFVYEHKWRGIENNIGSERIEHLAYLDMVLRGSISLSKKSTYQAQKTRLERRAADEADIERFVDDLLRRSSFLAMIIDPSKCPWPRVSAQLRNLKRLDNETTHPLSLRLIERLDGGRAEEEDVAIALKFAESFLVRRTLSGLTASGVNRAFTQLVNEIVDGAPVAAQVRTFLSKPSRRWATDEEIRKNVYSVPMYNIARNATLRHVLLSLEESLGHKELDLIASDGMSIEHIIPQVRPAKWEAPVVPQQGQDIEVLIHSIGNLTLTGTNSEMGNRVFAEKRAILRQSKLSLNVEIAEQEVWGTKEVISRADELASRIIELWPGPARSGSTISSSSTTETPSQPSIAARRSDTPASRHAADPSALDGVTVQSRNYPGESTSAESASVGSASAPTVTTPGTAGATPGGTSLGKVGTHIHEVVTKYRPGTELTIAQIASLPSSNYRRRQISGGAVKAWMDRNPQGTAEVEVLWHSTPLKARRR
ncbi:DUF262 domain-containing protein [Dietzia sp. SL131]|uniref:DUF262 domain-containing protein n=1 Tax=Dietzia sp. SL131 TaxID=2995149 RepID=UPI00227D19E8|nr:DUF262 domain-containing protein [Dietzia sp. SL131]MCY1659232.1 DUF262 domain-containing protein [Dietzia sp. SL131]